MDDNRFDVPVTDYMTQPVATIARDARLDEADGAFADHDISALAVLDEGGRLVGVVSRTDLLRAGNLEFGETLRLPKIAIERVMSYPPLTVRVGASIVEAANLMVEAEVHRVFVVDGAGPIGVVSTRDLMRAVRDLDVTTRLDAIASTDLITVRAGDPLGLATDRLELSTKQGLVVVDGLWPVGIFAQSEALSARGRDPKTRVEDIMDSRVIVLPGDCPLRRAAAQALAMGVRRLFVLDEGLRGVVSGLDFARAIQ